MDVLQLAGRLAAGQDGAVSRAQLLAAGATGAAVDRAVKREALRPVFRCVYAVGHLGAQGRRHAALLVAGSGAVLSHHDAAALWGFGVADDALVHVTVAGRNVRRQEGLEPHRVRRLDVRDVSRRHGLRVTTATRAVLDCAELDGPAAARRLVNEALVQRRTSLPALHEQLARSPGRRGGRVLAEVLELLDAGVERSVLEGMWTDFCREADLPEGERNVRIGGRVVDAVHREQQVLIELDSRAFHDFEAFDRDRAKDLDGLVGHWRTVRPTFHHLTRRRSWLAARMGALLLR